MCDFAVAQEDVELKEKSAPKSSKTSPTKIRSDIIDIKRKSEQVNFIGNVVVEKDDSSFLSNKMTILYAEKKEKKLEKQKSEETSEEGAEKKIEQNREPNKNKSVIKRVYTNEKVRIFSDEFTAVGDKGYYDPEQDIFVLEKNVMVNNGVSVARGDKFIHHIATKKSYFVGDQKEHPVGFDKRVTVILGDDAKEFKKSKEQQ